MSPSNRVDQLSVPLVFKDHQARIAALERQIGRWSYVYSGGSSPTLAPATPPENWNPLDPVAVPFQNGWGNVGTLQPVSFRIHPATKVQIRGNIGGGSIPSVVFTLPVNYRPLAGPVSVLFPSYDGTAAYTGRIDTNGDVNILGTIS